MNGAQTIIEAALANYNPDMAVRRARVLMLIRSGASHISEIKEATGAKHRSNNYGDIKLLAKLGFISKPDVPHGDYLRRRGDCPTVPQLKLTPAGERLAGLIAEAGIE